MFRRVFPALSAISNLSVNISNTYSQEFSYNLNLHQLQQQRQLQVRVLSPQTILKFEDRILPPRADHIPPLESRPLQSSTRRCGALAIKVGVVWDWDEWGRALPSTVLWIDDCQVTQVKLQEFDGTTSLQVGCGWQPDSKLNAALRGHFRKQGVPGKIKLAEFQVSRDALMPVGSFVTSAHFVPGQLVDVTGITIGYGFQGVIKKWKFGGGPSTHGSNKFQRRPGAIGTAGPWHGVVPGKRMAGRVGGTQYTNEGMVVWKVDPQRNLVYVVGKVPGYEGNYVLVRDSQKMIHEQRMEMRLPCPTFIGAELPEISQAKFIRDPYHVFQPDK